jgi:hypothetical protein
MAKIITNEPIEVINPVQIGASELEAERIPFGGINYYKPDISILDDGELLMTVAGPREYVYYNRPLELQKHHEDAFLYRSRDGGVTWSEPELLPAHSSKEAHLTVLKDGTIMMNAHCVQKQKTNPLHYGHTVLHRSEDRGRTWTTRDILMEDMPGAGTTVNLKGCRDKLDSIDCGRDIIEFDDGDTYYRSWGPGRVKEGLSPIGNRKSIRVRALLEVADCTYVPGPWVELPLVTEDNLHESDIGQMIGGSHNVLELDDGTLLCGVGTREGYERVWVSKDSGKTWDNSRVATFEDFILDDPKLYWCSLFQESYLYKGDRDKIYAVLRVDERYFEPLPGTELPDKEAKDDQSERMVVFESADEGRTWGNRKNLGTYGEMYPSIIKLQDGRLLLTYTVRALSPRIGVRAVLGYEDEDGLHFDFESDLIVIESKSPEGAYSGGGFGNTVQLDDGTLLTPYTFTDGKNLHAELARWRLPS